MKCVFQWSFGVVEWREIDSVACSDDFNLVDPFLSDEASALRERLEPALQSESHAFE